MSDTPRIFIAYSHHDKHLLQKLRTHLNVMKRQQHCEIFFDGEIMPGETWDKRLKDELHAAHIFVLLVTEDFLDSDYVNETELPKILERRGRGEAEVVAVVLKDCLWDLTELQHLQVVLKDGHPIEQTGSYAHAAREVFRVIETRNENLRLKREAVEEMRHQAEEAVRQKAEAEKRRKAEEALLKAEEAERQRRRALDPFHDLMVKIEGGSFEMGDTFGEGNSWEKPVHKVTVKDFHLCKYPVTQAQWKAIMGDPRGDGGPSYFKGEDLPVENINWDEAQAFIKKLNGKTGNPLSGGGGYRLPTEAEWEYAARERGKKVRFGNGKDIADPKDINFNGSEKYKKPYSVVGEYRGKTTPVGSLNSPNALGLHDMSGNVWEWCQDVWHEDYKGAPTDGSALTSGGDQSRRVVRGGSWFVSSVFCRSADRYGFDADFRLYNLGFRLAR